MMDIDKGFKAMFIVWIILSALSLSVVVGIVCVAVHFISKYW